MRGTGCLLMLAVIGLLLAVAVPPASPTQPRLHVQMHVDEGVSLDVTDLRIIAADVQRIWAPVLDVVVSLPNDLRQPGAVDVIRLVLTRRTLDSGDSTGLGWTEFVDGEPRNEITVSVTAASRLMIAGSWRGAPFSALPGRASRLFIQRALARAAAHEIGHYLLRSRTHEKRGLMRPVFTVDELMDRRKLLDRIEPASADRLRQAFPQRARADAAGDR
jgi:hypothetical protein